jgi:cobalt-zinc-cadmium efflux system protein
MNKQHDSDEHPDHAHQEHDHAGHDHAGHDHAGHDHTGTASEQRLRAALALLLAFTVVEAVGGFWSNSIALLAEAAHMLADSASLLLAIVAIRVGRRPADARRTYGNRRYQTLAAYTNGVTLLALTAWIVVEASRRLIAPPQVNGKVMLGIAVIGGIANLAAFVVLSGAKSLNERGARAHILSDLLGSGAATAAACVVLLSGWLPADPLLSIAVSVLIFRSGWQLTRESGHILLEGTPPGFSVRQVEMHLAGISGVCSIHHVHAWSLTGESPMVTLHAEISDDADRPQVLTAILSRLRETLGVEHATVQMEHGPCADPDAADDCHDSSVSIEHGHEGHSH